jgi:hypothetical protein
MCVQALLLQQPRLWTKRYQNLRVTPTANSAEQNTHWDAVHQHFVDGTLVQLVGVASHNPVCGLTR